MQFNANVIDFNRIHEKLLWFVNIHAATNEVISMPKLVMRRYVELWSEDSLYEISDDNGQRLIDFASSKNLVIKSTCFTQMRIHKRSWESLDGITFN